MFGGKVKLGILTVWLVYIVYLCSGFMLVFSKLNKKVILDITVSLCILIYENMHIGYTK
jgi:hypothetical protein